MRFLSVCDEEGVMRIVPRDGGVKKVGTDGRDVLKQSEHMQVKGTALLEFEALKVCFHVLGGRVINIGLQVCPPSIRVAASDISPHYLFQDVRQMYGFESSNLGDVFPVDIWDVVYEGGNGKVHSCGEIVIKSEGKPYWWTASLRKRC